MGSCLSKLGNKSNTVKSWSSNPECTEIKKCEEKELSDSSHKSISLSPRQKTTNVCQKEVPSDSSHTQEFTKECLNEMDILPILKHRSLSLTKLSAIKKEQALSLKKFSKPTYIRDHTECKETFKAIGGEGEWARKQNMLDQALEYFTGKAEGKREQYYEKLQSLCPTSEEWQSLDHERSIRLAERQRWSNVKSSQNELSVNDLIFVSHNENFGGFKKSLAAFVHISYPFTEEQLQSRSYWKDNSMIAPHDANEAVFPLRKAVLVENPDATTLENMFTEAYVNVDPTTLRKQVYSNKDAFDTALDEERNGNGLNVWEMYSKGVGLSETELAFYETFWKPTDKFALNTSLDEERVASGLNEWEMFAMDTIKNDVCTSKQEVIVASRSSRGPLSAILVRKRVIRLAEYFSKHKFIHRHIIAPGDVFFTERVSVQTPSDYAAIVKKHRDLEAALFARLAKEGAPFTETFGSEKEFKFKSPEAKTFKDGRMALRARERAKKI